MKTLILLTNDNGIHYPGRAAAAAALVSLEDLLIVAPQEQQSSMDRSRSQDYVGEDKIIKTKVSY